MTQQVPEQIEEQEEEVRFPMYPTETQFDFIMSEAFENCIMGPRGEGKTEAGIMAMTMHADLQDDSCRPVPWAIIRDTWTNLERTTVKSFVFPEPKSFAETIRPWLIVRNGGRYIELPGFWYADLFGIDCLKDLNDLQSLQLGGLWIEEAAPAAVEDIGGGVIDLAYTMGLTSLRHNLTTQARAQITMNYPEEDHWTWQRFFHSQDESRRLFRIRKGENVHVTWQYRKNMEAALAGKPELLARLVHGRPAQVQAGEAVTPDYVEDQHRSPMVLDPMPRSMVFRFWDGGRNPTCHFGQISPRGRYHGLDTLRGENTGMKQFLQDEVKPLIATRYKDVKQWRDFGDPSIADPEETGVTTAARLIEEELKTTFEGGERSFTGRREVMHELLTRMVDGAPMFQLSRHDIIMHRALNGGWHYHKDSSGRVLRDQAVKDIHSHPGDAISHGMAKIFKYKDEKGEAIATAMKSYFADPKKRARSYAVGSIHSKLKRGKGVAEMDTRISE